ncbi:hypothetical protein H920_11756 [Fukomys damarensis]|uniref:Uncharacterized protein n=1 Tax=Fukomys damarensis TaxID=885580 RepID=A0A091DVN8_FUKDA|nr:hypothetical protein H920_11756 [Fukomys damarensis]
MFQRQRATVDVAKDWELAELPNCTTYSFHELGLSKIQPLSLNGHNYANYSGLPGRFIELHEYIASDLETGTQQPVNNELLPFFLERTCEMCGRSRMEARFSFFRGSSFRILPSVWSFENGREMGIARTNVQ